MCTVIKVKRKITEDPVECLIIECKKKKSKTTILEEDGNENTATKNGNEPSNDSSTASTIKQILKYVGSASKDEEIEAKIKEVNSKPNKDRVKLKAKKPTDTSKRVDFVMVSKKRGLNQSESNSTNLSEIPSKPAVEKRFKPRIRTNNSNLDNINIIDVISSDYFNEEDTKKTEDKTEKAANRIACNGVEMVREKVSTESEKIDDGYVYDIYYAPKSNESIHLDLLYPSNVEIRGCSLYTESELIDERNSSDEKEDEYAGELEEDDDSNDEQNWRNDYPDEEEDYSDNDIDEENDEEPPRRSAFASYRPTRRNYFDNDDEDDEDDHYADNYDEYVYGYDDDDPSGKKLASQMKKSLGLDRYNDDSEKDDYDEYKNEPLDRSYQAYKRRILKEFKKDYNEDY